jgi:hypothetical protein
MRSTAGEFHAGFRALENVAPDAFVRGCAIVRNEDCQWAKTAFRSPHAACSLPFPFALLRVGFAGRTKASAPTQTVIGSPSRAEP